MSVSKNPFVGLTDKEIDKLARRLAAEGQEDQQEGMDPFFLEELEEQESDEGDMLQATTDESFAEEGNNLDKENEREDTE